MAKRLKRVRTREAKTAVIPFQGEVMCCPLCDKHQRSDPQNDSGWTRIQVGEDVAYFCPNCWHGIGKEHGYDNMGVLAAGIAMGGVATLTFGRYLVRNLGRFNYRH